MNEPFPVAESYWEELRGLLGAGFIVGAILYLFQPFGFDVQEGPKLLICIGFGLVTIVVGFIVNLIRYFLLPTKDEQNYSLKRWLAETLVLIVFIAIGNYLYLTWLNSSPMDWRGLVGMLRDTILIGIFPTVFFGFRKQLKLARANAMTADTINEDPERIKPNESSTIMAIEAMQNYVHIYKVTGDVVEKETLRMTLKKAQDQFEEQGLIKCHRSYLVQPACIESVSGNAQGLRLEMRYAQIPIIPVSRSFIKSVKEQISRGK